MDEVSKAQQSDKIPKQLRSGYPNRWKKGQSGNPGGRPRKLRLTKILDHILSKPKERREIEQIIKDVLAKRGMASVLLLREMMDRTEGKISQELELSGSITTLSDEDLAAKLAKLNAKQ